MVSQPDSGWGALFTELTEGGVLSNSPGVGSVDALFGQVAAYRALANARGFDLVAFEGGQHVADIFGVDAATEALFTAPNRDARMGQLYDDYFSMWRQEGGGLFVNYTAIERSGRFDARGALDHVGQQTSPNYEALMRAIGTPAT